MSILTLEEILVNPLKRIPTAGGEVLHALKASDEGFCEFGEAYFSWIEQGKIKAWKCHTRMTLNLAVPLGKIKFVFHLPSLNNDFRSEIIGEERYVRLTVPPGIWFGFQGLAKGRSLLINIADLEHESHEVLGKTISEFDFAWDTNFKI